MHIKENIMGRSRGHWTAQMVSRLESDGISICQSDNGMLGAYLRSEISGKDLLAHVCQFKDLSSYQQWLRQCFGPTAISIQYPVSIELLMREVEYGFRRKYGELTAKLTLDRKTAGSTLLKH
jgi:hypothetical protein